MNGTLVLIRHGESEWNAKNVWTGLTNIGLTQKGRDEAIAASQLIRDIQFDAAYTSELLRAQQTLEIILRELHKESISVTKHAALNERDYGIFTGKNKSEIKTQLGDAEFLKLRRGWDYPISKGESLKQVYARVVPYFQSAISPLVCSGKKILIVAHGNSLRALIKKLESVSDADIPILELVTGEVIVYRINQLGQVISHERRTYQ